MAAVVRMPSVLAGATEAALAHWLVAPGDSVTTGTPLAEIETEKALVEYAAEEPGTVGRLVLGEGDSAAVGDPIAVLTGPGETDADIDAALGAAEPAPAAAAAPPATRQAETAATNGSEPASATPAGPGRDAPQPGANGSAGRVFASPLVRKRAGERGIDLGVLTGTGPNGRIVRRDLERFLAASASSAPPRVTGDREAGQPSVPPDAGGIAGARTDGGGTPPAQAALPQLPPGATLVPHSPMRRAIARRLTESATTVPHFTLVTECVVDELLALRRRVNEATGVRVTVNDFVVAAVAGAFAEVPEANVTWTGTGLLAYRHVDISIAVATDGGLVTPVLRGVEGLRLSAIARESAALAERARERRLRQDELEGGTFTVSNLGMYGTAEFTAIINPPQSGILAVGAARSQPVVIGGEVLPATVLRCTLSADHRAIDGALAARWLAAFSTRLENPLSILV
jgi:pyruvate dehydrogenase E2 component (dihydrolipoamide acetyltransferase)